MAWYGNHVDASKKLDQLIDQNPSLDQLLSYPDFIAQLKAYNPKLLDFLTNSNTIVGQLIHYISVPPKDNDQQQRKYKYPTLAIQMIESQAMSVINSFFKQDPKRKIKFFNLMFQQQFADTNKVDGQVLPMLAGYFLRVNISLLNNKYRQTIDCMYQNGKNFDLLLQNSHSLSITNTLQVFLNLDSTKNPQTSQQRLVIKINAINKIMKLIDQSIELQKKGQFESQNEQYYSTVRVQNLSSVLIELLEKYYLIADGKQMVDQILYQENNNKILFKHLLNRNSDISMSLLNILISIVKYYSLSSFNNQQYHNVQQRKKNQQKLQSQPSILLLIQTLPLIISELAKSKVFTIFQAKLVQLINTSIMLNSHKIFNCIKNSKYFQILIDLMFRFQYCNIFGTMLQKLFLLIFRNQRLINQEIKHYIFCQAKIIDITAGRYLLNFQNDQQVSASMGLNYRRKAYFGFLMKIMKIYSGIQTTDQDIINSIKNKSQIWNKISRFILKPYQSVSIKQLSSYENIPQMPVNQFSVKTIIGSNTNLSMAKQAQNTKLIDQINRQQAIQNLKTLQNSIQQSNKIQAQIIGIHKQNIQIKKTSSDQYFQQTTQSINDKSSTSLQNKQSNSSKNQSQNDIGPIQSNMASPTLQKKANSYSDFIQRQKVKAQTQIKKQRSRSKERALSKGKTRITSPSPTKQNKWAQNNDQKPVTKQKISLTQPAKPATTDTPRNLPKIPMHKKGINVSTLSSDSNSNKEEALNKSMQLEKKQNSQIELMQNKSMPNLQMLKKVKLLYRFDPPVKKQYRKINQEDRAILDCLGIGYN